MHPKQHLILGLIFSSILVLLFPQIGVKGFLIIVLSSVLVDVDHYIHYVYKTKNLNLRTAWHQKIERIRKLSKLQKQEIRKYKFPIIMFHGIEFWIILLLATIMNKLFFWVFLGVMFHMTCDLAQWINSKAPLYPKLSQIYTHIKNKDLKEFINTNE